LIIKIYKIIVLSFALYGCETLSHTLREECRLMVFVNGILYIIYGTKMVRMGWGGAPQLGTS
jgi:hypothetical protein